MMPNNAKPGSDPNARLLASMGSLSTGIDSLTRELGRLTEHQASAEGAATRRAADIANATSLAARSQPGSPTVPAAVNATSNGASAAMAVLQNLNQMRQTPPDKRAAPDRSSPPGSPVVEPEDLNNPSPGEALTFAMLGAQGGPFGNLRMRQYMLQRNLGWAQDVVNKSSDWINADQPSTLGNVMGNVPGLSHILGWAGSNKGEDGRLTGGILSKVIDPQSGKLTGLGTGGLVAYTAASKAIDAITNWQRAGLDLGYGNEQSRGALGFHDPLRQLGATKEGLALTQERLALEGRLPKFLGGTGLSANTLTSADATAAVGTLAAQGFGEQNPGVGSRNMVNGDNYRIAQNLMAPLMNMGLTAADAAQWTPALRNANTSMQTLMETLQHVPAAAKAAKLTVGDFSASLEETARMSVSQGGTLQGGMQTGMAFTESTGMAPALGSAISQSPIYQSLMMGRYGVLPSGIPNLPGGAQVQGMLGAFNMLRGAFSGLNKDRFETVGGVKLHTAYGYQMQDAQIAQTLGIDQATVNRLRRESRAPKIASVLGDLGNAGSNGVPGTGIWEILGRAKDWQHLSPGQQGQASHVWNAILGNRFDPHSPIHQLGLKPSEIKDIYGTSNIHDRMNRLQKDLLGSQQTDKTNSITVYVAFKGEAAKHLKQAGPSTVKLNALSGQGQSMNSFLNSPLGDAAAANHQTSGVYPGIGTPSPSNTP